MGLHYDINQKQLKAENKFLIDHFTLGPRNDSTNATHLPVKLAVALLKDRNGQINLDIPLSGRTDDPKFTIAPLVFKVVVNLIEKAATSPFSLLGALVGGGEELSFVEFEPGRADIPDAEAQKLEKLVKALYERPAVNLEIGGSFDREKDRAALASAKLEQQLKVLRLKELADAGKPVPSMEALQLEPAERERLLKQVLMDLGTNQTLVLQVAATAPIPTPLRRFPRARRRDKHFRLPPARFRAVTTRTNLPTSGTKGATDLMTVAARSASTNENPPPARPLPTAHDGAPLTPEQIEAKLVAAIQVSVDEQRDLIKQRAQAVQSCILKTGKVAPERLFIVTPKSGGRRRQRETRANLSLD